ncbi:hypothetical protein C2E23DRAFT_516389 [Lenzites betulinus]|nr:hypothetical protein C2E23DRAFT_516389 [Lenzites betulinus]
MGVPGLWDILRPAGKPRSLTHLSVEDGFEANPDGKRGFRVGIDASIWFYHATYGREGENPELRTLFFRCARLMTMPFLPLFVFDGPKRPDIKRGKRITGKNHWMVQGMQEIITAFGFEWRMAPGEAEAELAYLNRIGVIDAVLSDDVDTFLFGARTVLRNPSATLSGNRAHQLKNTAGREDGNHVMIYRSSDILNREDIQLTQGGLILIGILRGGDYCQEGLDGCGVALAHGLAKCGFGDTLLQAARTKSREELETFLDGWRDEIRTELRTNARGHLPRKSPKLARSVPDDFPSVDVVLAYTTPVTSEAKGLAHKNAVVDWDKEPDLGKIAALCEMYFEWGVKEIIIKRFRTVLWPAAVLRILRRAAILKDRKDALLAARGAGVGGVPSTPRKNGKESRVVPGTPSSMIARHFSTMKLDSPHARQATTLDEEDEDEDDNPLIVKIHSSRQHPSTDNVLEYRLEIAPAQLVRLCEGGLKGLRTAFPPDLSDDDDDDGDSDDEKGKKRGKKPPPDPESHVRIWLPACMVEIVEPEMVDEFEGVQKMKADKKAAKAAGAGKGKKAAASASKAAPATARAKAASAPALLEEEDKDSSDEENRPQVPPPKAKPPPPAKKPSKPVTKSASVDDSKGTMTTKRMDQFYAAKKSTAAGPPKAAKTAASSAGRVADLFKDAPSATQNRAPTLELSDSSDDDTVPRPPHLSRMSSTATSTSSAAKSTSPSKGASRILSLLEGAKAGPSKLSAPARPPAAASASASASTSSVFAPEPSPSKTRAPRPFPMEFDFFADDAPQPSPVDEDLFTTTTAAGPSSGSGSRSSSVRTRTRSALSSDSDAGTRTRALQKSPRKSHAHGSPSKTKLKAVAVRQEQEQEESESESELGAGRPPSPSPVKGKGRLPTTLGRPMFTSPTPTRYEEEEEEEGEGDRAPSPSPARRRVLPPSKQTLPLGARPRKLAPLPADLSIISISSDSESDERPPLPPPPLRNTSTSRGTAPLQQARARLGKTSSASSSSSLRGTSSGALPVSKLPSASASRRAPQRIYDPHDVIDLTA